MRLFQYLISPSVNWLTNGGERMEFNVKYCSRLDGSREVALCQVHSGVRLVIQAVINLGRVAEVTAVLAVDHPIEAAVVAPSKKGRGMVATG